MSRIAGKRRTRPQPPAVMDRIDFESDEIEAASRWHGGQSSMLYAVASTGALSRGTIRRRTECDVCGGFKWECPKCFGHGQPMTDDQWLVDLAEDLEHEAEAAAAAARELDDDDDAEEDAEALDAIAEKCRAAIMALCAHEHVYTASHASGVEHQCEACGKAWTTGGAS